MCKALIPWVLAVLGNVSEGAHATEPALVGSITRIDSETYRLTCEFQGGDQLPEWALPPWGDCSNCATDPSACGEVMYSPENASSVSLVGSFGTPENISCVIFADASSNSIACLGFPPEVSFDFRIQGSESQLRIDYQVSLQWSMETYWCGTFGGRSLRGEGFSGTLLGDLPQGVGDTSPLRQIPNVVEAKSWSRVKQLYK